MRDRLIELIRFAYQKGRTHEEQKQVEETMADYLLENGVIVPPCKVGDILYDTDRCRYVVNLIMFDGGTLYYKCGIENLNENKTFTEYDIGQKVFLTREDAVKNVRKNNEL